MQSKISLKKVLSFVMVVMVAFLFVSCGRATSEDLEFTFALPEQNISQEVDGTNVSSTSDITTQSNESSISTDLKQTPMPRTTPTANKETVSLDAKPTATTAPTVTPTPPATAVPTVAPTPSVTPTAIPMSTSTSNIESDSMITGGVEYRICQKEFEVERHVDPSMVEKLDTTSLNENGDFKAGYGVIKYECTFKNISNETQDVMVNCVSIACKVMGEFELSRFETRYYEGIDLSKEIEMQKILSPNEEFTATLYAYARHCPFFDEVDDSLMEWHVVVNPSGTYPYNENFRSMPITISNIDVLSP